MVHCNDGFAVQLIPLPLRQRRNSMIVITGAAGFIGSRLAGYLNEQGFKDLILADDFSVASKQDNWKSITYKELVHRSELFEWLDLHQQQVQFIVHLGARTDTTEFRKSIFDELNLGYSKKLWLKAVQYSLPVIYASSAATYGMGELGYSDSEDIIPDLKPLNPYGESKNDFDKWVLNQERKPFFWAGLKFFNVYGPGEYHKSRMASVIYHAYYQIKATGKMKLFKSHHPDFGDGEQLRDFVYVKDVVSVILFLMKNRTASGIYNLGTGKARSFNELTQAVFSSLEIKPIIEYIDTPEDIREKYQYYTCAEMHKLRETGYLEPFSSLEEGINDYVKNYLQKRG